MLFSKIVSEDSAQESLKSTIMKKSRFYSQNLQKWSGDGSKKMQIRKALGPNEILTEIWKIYGILD